MPRAVDWQYVNRVNSFWEAVENYVLLDEQSVVEKDLQGYCVITMFFVKNSEPIIVRLLTRISTFLLTLRFE